MLVMVIFCTSCSKEEDPAPIPIPTPPVVSPPSGIIESFTITETLKPYNTPGAILKWLVTGTNNQTLVTINGVKVAEYGIQDVGPLKLTTKFMLEVNSGKRDSVILKVADSVTTLLWNKGKRLKLVKRERYIYPTGSAIPKWVLDTPYSPAVLDERIYFHYSNTSEIYQLSANRFVALADGGKFTVSNNQQFFSWRGILYTILLLDINFLVVEFDETQSNGTTKVRTMHTYQYE